MGGGCGRNGSNWGFRPRIRPKTRCFFDRNMDHLTSEWPGTKNLKGCANFDMEHRKWEKSLFVAFRPIAKILDYYEGHTIWKLSSSAYRKCHGFLCYFSKNIFIFNPTLSCNNVSFHMAYPGYLRKFLQKRKTFAFALFSSILDLFHRKSMGNQWSWSFDLFHWFFLHDFTFLFVMEHLRTDWDRCVSKKYS